MQSFFTDIALASHDNLIGTEQGFLLPFTDEESGIPSGGVSSQKAHSEEVLESEFGTCLSRLRVQGFVSPPCPGLFCVTSIDGLLTTATTVELPLCRYYTQHFTYNLLSHLTNTTSS